VGFSLPLKGRETKVKTSVDGKECGKFGGKLIAPVSFLFRVTRISP
jgi:hypothetical protein